VSFQDLCQLTNFYPFPRKVSLEHSSALFQRSPRYLLLVRRRWREDGKRRQEGRKVEACMKKGQGGRNIWDSCPCG
jgi:hypothetical protein